MQASALLFCWGNYHWACNLWVLIIYFSSQLCCPLWFQGSPQTWKWECFLVFGNFFLCKTPFPGWSSIPTSFVSFFVFYIFSHLLLKTLGCFSGCLMSSASIQKLFCEIYSAFKCSFDEFVGEKVVSPSYSSTIFRLYIFSKCYCDSTLTSRLFRSISFQYSNFQRLENSWSF